MIIPGLDQKSTNIILITAACSVVFAAVMVFLFIRLNRRKKDKWHEKEKMLKAKVKADMKRLKKQQEEEKARLEEEKYAKSMKDYDALRTKKAKLNIKTWLNILKDKIFSYKTVLINMELINGMHRQFLVMLKPDNSFKYRGRMYVVDDDCKYFVIDSKLWCYDFHENFTLPIKRKLPMTTVRKSIEASGVTEIEYMTNPATLERFSISKIAEGIMKGQQIDEFFKKIQMFMIITMVACLIHLILFMFKTGMLQSIKIPGVN